MKQKILILSESVEAHLVAKHILEAAGFSTILSQNVEEALRSIESEMPDAVVVDCRAEKQLGERLCVGVRSSRNPDILFIALIEQGAEQTYLDLIRAGCDRCFHRPFEPLKLIEYLQYRFKPSHSLGAPEFVTKDGLELDIRRGRASYMGNELTMGDLEFKLLLVLLDHAGEAIRREQLIEEVWPNGVFVDPRTVDVHIRNLRRAMREVHAEDIIKTTRGIGYHLQI